MNREERRWGVTREKGEGDQKKKVTSGRRGSDMGKKIDKYKKVFGKEKKEIDEKIHKEKR